MSEKEKTKQQRYQKVSVSNLSFERLNQFKESTNKTSKRRIRIPEVLDYLIERLSDGDIPRIQERCYTATDRLAVLLDKLNSQNP